MNEHHFGSIVIVELTQRGADVLNELNEQCNIQLIKDTGCSFRTNYSQGSLYRNTIDFIFDVFKGKGECFTSMKSIES